MNQEAQTTIDINLSIKRTLKISMEVANEFWILLLGARNEELGIRLEKNICRKKESKTQLKQTGCLEEFLDDKAAFYNDSESDEACNIFKNRLQHRCVTMKFCKLFKDTFFTEYLRWLLLKIMNSSSYLEVLPIVTKNISTYYFARIN